MYTTLLGSSTGTTQFKGGSALQGPTVTLNVTATAPQTTDLQIKLGGQLPGTEPRNYGGAQPGNFAAPCQHRHRRARPPPPPFFSTNGLKYTSSNDTVWTDPTYLNTVDTSALGGLIHVVAKAACGPGYEVTGTFPTPRRLLHRSGRDPERDVAGLSHTLGRSPNIGGEVAASTAPTTSSADVTPTSLQGRPAPE